MGVHFISVLGTSLYEPVVYRFPERDRDTKEQEFIQLAMMEAFKEQITDGGKISIFLTAGARKRNWNDRLYDEKDAQFAERWTSARKQGVKAGRDKQGMKSILEREYPELWGRTNGIDISNASTEEEIWSVFETIYNTIQENDEIIFDITHSFRSIPMLAITIINYAKSLKNCTLKGIYYGAYEAGQSEEGVKYAPVVDLTIYNEILEWTNAAEAFVRYGFASQMREVYGQKMKTIPNNEKKEWGEIGNKITAMERMSSAIFTCRGTDASKLEACNKKPDAKKSIKNAYQSLKTENMDRVKVKAREIKPLYPLIEKIEKEYNKYFNGNTNVDIGCGVVNWSIENHMVQQGYTALEETMITYLCGQYGLDDKTEKTREDIVGRTLTGIIGYMMRKKSGTYFDEHREEAAEEIYRLLPGDKEEGEDEEKRREDIKKIVLTIPVPFVKFCNRVKEKRNDINHFGFRNRPATSEQLIGDLKSLNEEFGCLMKEPIDMSAYEDKFFANISEGEEEGV